MVLTSGVDLTAVLAGVESVAGLGFCTALLVKGVLVGTESEAGVDTDAEVETGRD